MTQRALPIIFGMGVGLQTLFVEEIIKKAESGITEPYLCRLSDGAEYYVKGKSATTRGLIAEFLCARLGQEFGLPIPPFAIASVSPELLSRNSGASASLGAGTVFASQRVLGALPISLSSLQEVPLETQWRLFLFDAWIKNEDRTLTEHGGNANFFISAETGEVFAIDHNLAFDRGFDFSKNLEMHVCKGAWASARKDLVHIPLLREQAIQSLKNGAIFEDIPDDWLAGNDGLIGEFVDVLERVKTAAFWELVNG